VRQTAHFILGNALRAEIFQNRIKNKQNGCSPAGEQEGARFAWKLFKIKFKIKQKLLLVRQTAHFILGVALRARNYSKTKYKN